MVKKDLDGIDTKTIEWQCTACCHLCKLLTDRFVEPSDIIKCKEANFKRS